jgi:hypothetical protein
MDQVSVLETNIGSSTTGNSANNQVIFNDDGTLRGDAGLTFNKTTDTLSTARITTSGDAIVCSSTGDFYVGSTVTPQFKIERATGNATITGDLTVDTSTLKVDSTNNRVGIGTATPGAGYSLDILGAAVGGIRVSSNNYPNLVIDSANSNGALIYFQEGGTTQARIGHLTGVTGLEFSGNNGTAATNVHYGIDATGISTWKNVGGVAGTAMTLNSTGLGVGVTSPSVKLDILGEIKSSGNITSTTGKLAVTGSGQTVGMQIDGFVAGASLDNYILNNSGNAGTIASLNFGRTTSLLYGFLRINNNTQILELGTAATARLSIDQTGNVGVGVTPSAKLDVLANDATIAIFRGSGASSNDKRLTITSGGAKVVFNISDNSNTATARAYEFQSAGSNVMTIDASGNLLVGATTALSSGSTFQNLGVNRQVLTLKGDTAVSYTSGIWNASTTGDALFQFFATETTLTVRGGISYNRAGGLVAYNTTSDYRAKDIIGPVSNSGSLIDSLKVYVGKMKGATVARPMLIAHEAQEVAPYAVTGLKDEVDADGKDKYQQMDVSSFVPLLIAEIQSLRARVQTLEAR